MTEKYKKYHSYDKTLFSYQDENVRIQVVHRLFVRNFYQIIEFRVNRKVVDQIHDQNINEIYQKFLSLVTINMSNIKIYF